MQRNINPEELLERAEKEAASQAVSLALKKHCTQVREIQDQYLLSNEDILSSNIIKSPNLPDAIKQEVAKLGLKLQAIINHVASNVEEHKYASYTEALNSVDFTGYERQRVNSLIDAEKKVHISCQSVKFTVELFSEMNKQILKGMEEAKKLDDAKNERRLVLENTILVYELACFVISFLESFSLNGIDEIEKLHKDMLAQIERNKAELQQLKKDAMALGLNPVVKDRELANIQIREQSLQMLREEWDNYLKSINEIKSNVASVSKNLPTLKFIRDNSKNQINFIELAMVTGIVKNNVDAIESLVLSLQDIELTSLPPERVRRLFLMRK